MGKPEKSFKCGSCDAAVFENEITAGGKTIRVKKVSFQKRYKDASGEWKNTNSLDVNDIPKAVLALTKAYEYLVLSDKSDSANSGAE
ncbi:hypothetical protein KQH27_00725 [bacterium]|nr:hypothetical protein [bacterium]